jgi:hypothetical protein
MNKSTNIENPKPRKVTITYSEYEAIRYGMDEIDNLIMSGDASKESVDLAKKHYDSLKKLIDKIIK